MSKGLVSAQKARRVLLQSFLLTSCLGAAALGAYWAARGQGERGLVRALDFVAVMFVVHAGGYFAYVGQPGVERASGGRGGGLGMRLRGAPATISPAYSPAIRAAALQQLIVAAFMSVLLCDCGMGMVPAVIAHWLGSALIIVRRPSSPTWGDLAFVRVGFWPVWAAVSLLAVLLHRQF